MLQFGTLHRAMQADKPGRGAHANFGNDGIHWAGGVDAATVPGVVSAIPLYRLNTRYAKLAPGLREVDEDMGSARPHCLVVRGAVQAGVWRDAIEWPETDWQTFAISGLSPKPNAAQPAFGLMVQGLSMNLVFPPGTILVCVRYGDLGCAPSAGDHVICQQRRRNGLVEATSRN